MKTLFGLLGLIFMCSIPSHPKERESHAAARTRILGTGSYVVGDLGLCLNAADSLQQFSMYPAKPAVAEDADHVTALNVLGHVSDNRLDIRQIRGGFAGTRQILH